MKPRLTVLQILVLLIWTNLWIAAEVAGPRVNPQESQNPTESKRKFVLRRADLNKPVSPFNVYIQILTSGDEYERMVTCVIVRNGSVSASLDKLQDQLSNQLIPYSYTWSVLDKNGKMERRWLAYFLKNRDGTYHTIVSLPQDELARSQLEIYFQDIDGDGRRENIKFLVDMSGFDWTPTTKQVIQGAQ